MLDDQIRGYAKEKAFHPQTLQRWLSWGELDRAALFRLAIGLKIGENHLRELMNWLEEIALRDRTKIHEILARKNLAETETDPRLGRADKIKRIKERMRRLRFPRLAHLEDSIRMHIQELRLHPGIKLSVAPGLEGGRLRAEFDAASQTEFGKLAGKLAAAADTDSMRQIFALLAGEPDEQSA
ncbi:MAG TPA: hypothetical protein VFU31_31650 [Candidatus Binatia bacterium]|nr:hypothetical protein [Candidatus Binatia bacterium]